MIIVIQTIIVINFVLMFGDQVKKEYDSDDEDEHKKVEVVEDPGTLNDEYR